MGSSEIVGPCRQKLAGDAGTQQQQQQQQQQLQLDPFFWRAEEGRAKTAAGNLATADLPFGQAMSRGAPPAPPPTPPDPRLAARVHVESAAERFYRLAPAGAHWLPLGPGATLQHLAVLAELRGVRQASAPAPSRLTCIVPFRDALTRPRRPRSVGLASSIATPGPSPPPCPAPATTPPPVRHAPGKAPGVIPRMGAARRTRSGFPDHRLIPMARSPSVVRRGAGSNGDHGATRNPVVLLFFFAVTGGSRARARLGPQSSRPYTCCAARWTALLALELGSSSGYYLQMDAIKAIGGCVCLLHRPIPSPAPYIIAHNCALRSSYAHTNQRLTFRPAPPSRQGTTAD